MRHTLETIGIVFIIIVLGASIGWCIGTASMRPLICRVYSWQFPEGKTVKCLKVGSDVRYGGAEEDTPTYEYPTYEYATATYGLYETSTFTPSPSYTPTRLKPWPTNTGTPYPEPETATPGGEYP